MDANIFFGGSVIASVIAGMIALFAPCCISVMLPAYFASSFQNRRLLVAVTFLFAAGVATVVLPIAMGATALTRLITTEHTTVFVSGGLIMLGLAVYLILGGQMHLPMPGRRAGGRAGPLSIYSLGIFSGVATSCCAPVLAGIIALSGVASSFAVALTLGTAYVFGMVAPLFVLSLLWDKVDWKARGLFRPRTLTWRLGPIRRSISATNLATAVLLALMSFGMIWLGLTSDGMPSSADWQARMTGRLQHYGKHATDAIGWLPGWAALGILVLTLAWLSRRALQQVGWANSGANENTDEESSDQVRAGIDFGQADERRDSLEQQGA